MSREPARYTIETLADIKGRVAHGMRLHALARWLAWSPETLRQTCRRHEIAIVEESLEEQAAMGVIKVPVPRAAKPVTVAPVAQRAKPEAPSPRHIGKRVKAERAPAQVEDAPAENPPAEELPNRVRVPRRGTKFPRPIRIVTGISTEAENAFRAAAQPYGIPPHTAAGLMMDFVGRSGEASALLKAALRSVDLLPADAGGSSI